MDISMPKPLTPEQVETLVNLGAMASPEARGSVGQGVEATQATLIALGNLGLPSLAPVERMGSDSTSNGSLDSLSSSPEGRAFAELVKQTHHQMGRMIEETGHVFSDIPNLDSPEFANTNWQRLLEATKAYEELNIPSQLVFTPINRPLGEELADGNYTPGSWRALFSGLRAWQDTNHPDSAHKLQNLEDGDGLWINNEVATQWNSVIDTNPNAPQWQVSVVPVSSKTPVLNVAHNGTAADRSIPANLRDILDKLPTGSDNSNTDPDIYTITNPKAETLFTIHAMRQFNKQDPIDGKIVSLYNWSWAEGTIDNGVRGLAVSWNPDHGQVLLSHDVVGLRGGDLGVRPEVRG